MFLYHFFELFEHLHPSFSLVMYAVPSEGLLFSTSSSYIAVVAIDFGTTYSGFAFCFQPQEGRRRHPYEQSLGS
ncbi:unnamed protein product [Pocillopora meandrina]|uniref:Uncharacterized protein n=1 Tax=Pocillopora meandrina TaxID=46732 RepID=A0AAU9XK86_9CNID|nr:unnamed protein product [Pocillopora meandrina]